MSAGGERGVGGWGGASEMWRRSGGCVGSVREELRMDWEWMRDVGRGAGWVGRGAGDVRDVRDELWMCAGDVEDERRCGRGVLGGCWMLGGG